MHTEADLIRKFELIERLFTGAKTAGEKQAASDALDRIKERLKQFKKASPPIEYKFTLTNMWSRRLLAALLRRYDIEPYRYARQRYTTVMAKMPKNFVDDVLWPQFKEFDATLQKHLDEITDGIISKAIFSDTSEAIVKTEKLLESN